MSDPFLRWIPESYRYSRRFWIIFYSIIGLSILIGAVIGSVDVNYFGVAGGGFGALCSSIVLINIWLMRKKKQAATTSLLFWRSVCDFGIGLRFLTGIYWNNWQCGQNFCTLADKSHCWAPSGLLEFFELSSEAWFLCVAMDLAVSVTDPFSTPKARLFKYHVLSWTFGIIMGIAVAVDKKINGIWWVTEQVSDHGFCWIQNHTSEHSINWKPFVFFYIPLLLVYGYASYVIVSSYQRLRLGISKTFQHRVQMLTVNAINVTVYVVYWTIVLIMYALVNELAYSRPDVAKWMFNVLIFFLSAKGFADLVVFIITTEVKDSEDDKGSTSDFNAALREEVLHFATTGIRVCAQRASTATESRRKVMLSMTQNEVSENNLELSPWFFVRLMFGSADQLEKMKAVMIRESGTRSTVPVTTPPAVETLNSDREGSSLWTANTGATGHVAQSKRMSKQIIVMNDHGRS